MKLKAVIQPHGEYNLILHDPYITERQTRDNPFAGFEGHTAGYL